MMAKNRGDRFGGRVWMGRPGLLLSCGLLIGLFSAVTGCSLFGGSDKLRQQAPELGFDEWREGSLHCKRGLCTSWYRLAVQQAGELEIEVSAPAHETLPDFSLVVEDAERRRIGEDLAPLHRPRQVRSAFEPGVYYVQLQGLDEDAELMSYKLIVRKPAPVKPKATAPRSAPAKPKAKAAPPPARIIESAVIEVERQGGEPSFVLIEAGSAAGVERGLAGELVDGGRSIGRIEVVDVYEAGSRARILGGLSAPITLDTVAKLRKP